MRTWRVNKTWIWVCCSAMEEGFRQKGWEGGNLSGREGQHGKRGEHIRNCSGPFGSQKDMS